MILYVPLGSAGKRYRPSGCVTVVCPPISAGDVAVTVVPGSTALCASVTMPVMRPWVICAEAGAAASHATARTTNVAAFDVMEPPR